MASLEVTASVLNLRAGPGTTHPVRQRLPRGTRLALLPAPAGAPADRWLHVRATLADGTATGWVSAAHVRPVDGAAPADGAAPPWYEVATRELGVREYPGPRHNPRIVGYHAATSMGASADEVPWCSSFANWCMAQAGLSGSGSAAARSWLAWGRPLAAPRPGCVVVLSRGTSPAQGHVGFLARERGAVLELLGGNQGNRVAIAPYAASRVLGYRWPAA